MMNVAAMNKGWRHAGAAMALCLLALQPVCGYAGPWNVDALMQSLAKTKQGRATFVEKKYIAVLDRPVESSGELSYSAPDRLEKKTVKPKAESMLLVGDVLTIERGRQKHTLQLQDYPELAGFIDGIRGTLTGDRKALERTFKLMLAGDAQRWTLTLAPHDAGVAQTVHQIQVHGTHDNVRSIDILQTDGDRSSMMIERMSGQ
jgi:hypothetical protein